MLSLLIKARLVWNWIQGKRITVTDPERGRVMVRTGRNSANRNTGGQWYLQSYEKANGPPPLPRCSRGRLDDPETVFEVKRFTGEKLNQARRWFESRHGKLNGSQDLMLACVYEPNGEDPDSCFMHYRPKETYEVEYPWLGSYYGGPCFNSYFGTWYGSGLIEDGHAMDFEIFWEVGPRKRILPKWGATWR
jgi:hypothetical protein